MKRSIINQTIEDAKRLLDDYHITLPPFAYWSPDEWTTKGTECDEIRHCMLGWDITDFGSGEFEKVGLVVFTVRNGHKVLPQYQSKTYCEKILIVQEDQVTPMHYHKDKQEDIIVRAGGDMVVQLHNVTESGELDDTDVTVSLDGISRTVPASDKMVLTPGESITLPPFLAHAFWAESGHGVSIIGEVSKVNDDNRDNFFVPSLPRFPEIEEDALPIHLLCTEYPSYAPPA
jgi:D-lyxose ketol-isomerase